MRSSKVFKYLLQRWFILPYLAVATFILTKTFAANPELVENYYGLKIYPSIAETLSGISASLPFSIDDIYYIFLISSAFIIPILLLARKISIKFSGKFVLNVLAATYILFYLLWGFNYFRPDLNQRLGLKNRKPDTDEFIKVFSDLVQQTNRAYTSFEIYDKKQIDSLAEESYQKLALVLGLTYPGGKRIAKNITFSRFFAQAGISGYYGPFFSEIHVNSYNLPLEYPFVLAHEKAHQFGITGEAEANFYAWMVCSQSDSDKLRYSANLVVLRYFVYQGYQLEQFNEIIKKLDMRVKDDLLKIREHWQQLRNKKIDRAASKVNDVYLKTNKIEKGVEDYHGVVNFVMDIKLDTAFQKKWDLKQY